MNVSQALVDWLCNELRRAGARHLTPDPCVLIGDFTSGK